MAFKNVPITEGNLWELGVLFPISNPSMERFEQFFKLERDVLASDKRTTVLIENIGKQVKGGCVIRIGPSSDKTRDGSGNLLYYGKYQIFLINYYTSSSVGDTIYLKKLFDDDSGVLEHNYLKDDPITIRGLADSWDFLKNNDFGDINSYIDPTKDGQYIFSRHNSVDDYKGFSQLITASDNVTDYAVGIIQNFDNGKSRTLLNRLAGVKARMSYWFRTAVEEINVDLGDDIDETLPTTGNDIDEIAGGPVPYDIIDERNLSSVPAIVPMIRLKLYNDILMSNSVLDESESWNDMEEGSLPIFSNKVVTIPEGVLSGQLAVYATFTPDPRRVNLKFLIDDVTLEHCQGTSKEVKGYYQVDINPDINVSISNKTTGKIEKDLLGEGRRVAMEDPNTRFNIKVKWSNRPGYFINDLKVLESWNREGYPIVLRTYMPGQLPYTLFCNIKVSAPSYNEGPNIDKSDVSVTFDEIAV